jgi:RNA polymerase sigma factor (TIGR02999 family)
LFEGNLYTLNRDTQVARLLQAHEAGDASALDQLVPLIYRELRHLARSQLRRRFAGQHSLNTTGLVHEAYLKMARSPGLRLKDPGHLMALTARVMHQVLVSRARARLQTKRGSGRQPCELDDASCASESDAEQLLDVDRALARLRARSEELASVFECRYIGLTEEDTAKALGMSLRAAQRAWMRARAWLCADLQGSGVGSRDEDLAAAE